MDKGSGPGAGRRRGATGPSSSSSTMMMTTMTPLLQPRVWLQRLESTTVGRGRGGGGGWGWGRGVARGCREGEEEKEEEEEDDDELSDRDWDPGRGSSQDDSEDESYDSYDEEEEEEEEQQQQQQQEEQEEDEDLPEPEGEREGEGDKEDERERGPRTTQRREKPRGRPRRQKGAPGRNETYLSRNGQIAWRSEPFPGRRHRLLHLREDEEESEEEEEGEEQQQQFREATSSGSRSGGSGRRTRAPAGGPTEEAAAGAGDVLSAFRLFVTSEIEDLVLEMTNLEGERRLGRGRGRRRGGGSSWKGMNLADLRAYVGLLILAGVYRSRGEAAESLWDRESGRAIFRATMSLKRFHRLGALLRFDDRETRVARRAAAGGDRLAAVRRLWDAWSARLPALYELWPDVTVDEQLVPFRGKCPFRQYMPSKPAKYGIKFWVACDAKSSYAWKMQVYTGKPEAPAEKAAAAPPPQAGLKKG